MRSNVQKLVDQYIPRNKLRWYDNNDDDYDDGDDNNNDVTFKRF